MPIVLPTFTESQGGGSVELADLGTGAARLGGVESYFLYGELLLNDRSLIDTYVVREVDGLVDADVRDTREPVPQGHGEHSFDSWYGGRTIVLSGYIRAHTIHKLRDMQEALKAQFVTLNEQPLRIVSPYKTVPHHSLEGIMEAPSVEILCKKSQPVQMRESQTNFKFNRDFLITLRASNPAYFSSYTKTSSVTSGSSPHQFALTNIGNYATGPVINLVGPMTNPVLSNAANGEVITITGVIGAGQTWTLDIENRRFFDQTGANKFSTFNIASDWLRLEPGDNDLTVTFTGGTGATTTNIQFRDSWI
jgi:hypothetical protein